MEKLPDGIHVRLRSREHGGYLHADDDRISVSLSLGLTSSTMAWNVHRILHDGCISVVLHSAAYHGRYLAATSDPAPPGHRVVLGEENDPILWKAVEAGNSGYVLLLHGGDNLLLRTNGGPQWGVSLDVAENESEMAHWKIESTPASLMMPPPPPSAAAMELLPYGALVRLQSRVHGGYLHADEDGMAVSLSGDLGANSVSWKVTRVIHDSTILLRLQNAVHGRYLALAASSDPPGHRAHRVVQADCDRNVACALWAAIGTGDAGYVLLRHASNRFLRANGSHGGGVSIAVAGNSQSPIFQWKVQRIPTPAGVPQAEALLEQFPDGAYVRLRSSVNGRYLHADEDGVRVDFRPPRGRGSLNAAWRVHRVMHLGTSRVLLQSAAYGRYLGHSRPAVPPLIQSIYYNHLPQDELLVVEHQGLDITLDGTPLAVDFIPTRRGLAPRVAEVEVHEVFFRRLVIYIQGDNYGNLDFTAARAMMFKGRSLSKLRADLANCLSEHFPERIVMCMWAGFHGRLIPLICDLPANGETIQSYSSKAGVRLPWH